MVQEFSFKETLYVAFELPTEVPDEILERNMECLFFDMFNTINSIHCFSCLDKDFDKTTYDGEDYPFETAEHAYFKYCAIPKATYNKITGGNFSSNENKSIIGGNNMEKLDLGQIISMKMVSSLIADDKKEIDIGRLYLLQSMQNNGKIEITDVMKSKMISKLGLDKDTDELPLEKLMLLEMLQSGEMDLTKIISVKLMSKLFDEEEKK